MGHLPIEDKIALRGNKSSEFKIKIDKHKTSVGPSKENEKYIQNCVVKAENITLWKHLIVRFVGFFLINLSKKYKKKNPPKPGFQLKHAVFFNIKIDFALKFRKSGMRNRK